MQENQKNYLFEKEWNTQTKTDSKLTLTSQLVDILMVDLQIIDYLAVCRLLSFGYSEKLNPLEIQKKKKFFMFLKIRMILLNFTVYRTRRKYFFFFIIFIISSYNTNHFFIIQHNTEKTRKSISGQRKVVMKSYILIHSLISIEKIVLLEKVFSVFPLHH